MASEPALLHCYPRSSRRTSSQTASQSCSHRSHSDCNVNEGSSRRCFAAGRSLLHLQSCPASRTPCTPLDRGCNWQSAGRPPCTLCTDPLSLISSLGSCSQRMLLIAGRWKCEGGCSTCSATRGSRGSGRRDDSCSQGTLTSPRVGLPRIVHVPLGVPEEQPAHGARAT